MKSLISTEELRQLRSRQAGTQLVDVRTASEYATGRARWRDRRLGEIELDDEHRRGAEQAVHRCLIHNTLLHPPQIAIDVTSVALVGTASAEDKV